MKQVTKEDRVTQILWAICCQAVLLSLVVLLPLSIKIHNTPLLVISIVILAIPALCIIAYAPPLCWIMTLVIAGVGIYFWYRVIKDGWDDALCWFENF